MPQQKLPRPKILCSITRMKGSLERTDQDQPLLQTGSRQVHSLWSVSTGLLRSQICDSLQKFGNTLLWNWLPESSSYGLLRVVIPERNSSKFCFLDSGETFPSPKSVPWCFIYRTAVQGQSSFKASPSQLNRRALEGEAPSLCRHHQNSFS